jgi:hypothetical protein
MLTYLLEGMITMDDDGGAHVYVGRDDYHGRRRRGRRRAPEAA